MKYLIPVAIIILALLAANGVYVVNQGQAAALSGLGQVRSTGNGPGLHFKVPFLQRATMYDTRELLLQAAPADYKTADGEAVRIGFYVRWQVADPDTYLQATSDNKLEVGKQMVPVVRAALRAQVARHSEAELLAALGGDIGVAVRDAVAAPLREKLGVNILDVGIRRVLPPDNQLPQVYKRMSAGAKARAAAIHAAGAAAAAAARAKGDSGNQQVLAAAREVAGTTRGKGDAAAAAIYAQAATQDPGFFRYWSSLNTWRESFSGGGAVVVLDKDSPLVEAIDPGTASGSGTHKH